MSLTDGPAGMSGQEARQSGLPLRGLDGALEGFGERGILHNAENTTKVVIGATTNVVFNATTALVTYGLMLKDRVKQERKAKGWSQAELAKRAKVSQQLIGKLENGDALESRKLPQIASALGLQAEQLLTADGSIPEKKQAYHGILLTRAGALLAAEWEKLDLDDRVEVEADILDRVAKRKRRERARRPGTSADS